MYLCNQRAAGSVHVLPIPHFVVTRLRQKGTKQSHHVVRQRRLAFFFIFLSGSIADLAYRRILFVCLHVSSCSTSLPLIRLYNTAPCLIHCSPSYITYTSHWLGSFHFTHTSLAFQ